MAGIESNSPSIERHYENFVAQTGRKCVMKSLIPLPVLSFIAPSALAGGLKDERLDSATFCVDPVIRHLDRGIFFNESRDCCAFGDPWIAANNLAQLAQFDLERGSQFVAAALIDQGLEWLRQSVFGV